jgi:hypothetical protein
VAEPSVVIMGPETAGRKKLRECLGPPAALNEDQTLPINVYDGPRLAKKNVGLLVGAPVSTDPPVKRHWAPFGGKLHTTKPVS